MSTSAYPGRRYAYRVQPSHASGAATGYAQTGTKRDRDLWSVGRMWEEGSEGGSVEQVKRSERWRRGARHKGRWKGGREGRDRAQRHALDMFASRHDSSRSS
jgi:hypothetical protein